MRRATLTISALLFCWTLYCALPLAAGAAGDGSCTAAQSLSAYRAAHRAALRAEARACEARHVLNATRLYSGAYGGSVGRWVRLARREGWKWRDIPVLMLVIYRESGGRPDAANPYSSARGLLQLLAGWYLAQWWPYQFDPMNARLNLFFGRWIWKSSGWHAWVTAP